MGPAKEPLVPGFLRGVAAARQVPQIIRQAGQDPERAAKNLARAASTKISEALEDAFPNFLGQVTLYGGDFRIS
jgi:hypothetical protein